MKVLMYYSLWLILILKLSPVGWYYTRFFRVITADTVATRIRKSLVFGSTATAFQLYPLPQPLREQALEQVESESDKKLQTSLVGGSIAFAAWTQLFVSADNWPAKQLSGLSLSVLFAGAAILLIIPLFFRVGGRFVVDTNREVLFYAGFNAIVVSMALMVYELRESFAYRAVAVVVVGALVLRELAETITAFRRLRAANYENAVSYLDGPDGDEEKAEGNLSKKSPDGATDSSDSESVSPINVQS